jgi:hypothetical protein
VPGRSGTLAVQGKPFLDDVLPAEVDGADDGA